MDKYYKHFTTLEERNKAVLEAIEETRRKNRESKEEARAFLERAGIILEDAPETKAESETKNS